MSKYFVPRQECSRHSIALGVEIFTAACERLMLSWVELQPHSEVAMHQHPQEQMGLLIEGELTFTIGDEKQVLAPGDIWRVPGGVTHGCIAGAAGAKALDVFHPIREDYL